MKILTLINLDITQIHRESNVMFQCTSGNTLGRYNSKHSWEGILWVDTIVNILGREYSG